MSSYKQLKEAFVTGYSGSSTFDIASICLFLPVTLTQLSLLLRNTLVKTPSFLFDFFFTVIPIILSVCWTEYTFHKLSFLIFLILLNWKSLQHPLYNTRPSFIVQNYMVKHIFISDYRSLLMIATCISILAVDFPIYPRRFVKTQTEGVSLMDLGTGSVLFASALVARHNRLEDSQFFQRVKQAASSCLPLIVLGFARLVLHKFIEYQEHVSEYGVHWNFFTSLSVVILASGLIKMSSAGYFVVSVCMMVGYQVCLEYGLSDIIFNSERKGFLLMNRQGIFGCIGFFSIYHISMSLKDYIADFRSLMTVTFLSMVVCWGCFLVVEPSRRLVRYIQNNISYVVWVISHNLVMLTLTYLAERSVLIHKKNCIIEAINYNQFPYFVLSNLLTGVVNLSIFTIFTPDYQAFLVLVVYQAVVCFGLHTLAKNKFKLKFW